jgi:hypothetical protein
VRSHIIKNLLVIFVLGVIGFIISPVGMNILYALFPVNNFTMVRQMLPYLFIVWPLSLLICMTAILMLMLLIRSLLFGNKNEPFEDNFIVEKLERLDTHQASPSQIDSKPIRFPEDYSPIEALVYILCGMVMIWMVTLKVGLWQAIAPIFGCVFLAAGLIIMIYNVLSTFIRNRRLRYVLLGGIGLLICLIPFLISSPNWIYRYSILPAGLLCFSMASYRIFHYKY